MTAASSTQGTTGGNSGSEEFLVLMEYCPNVLSELLKARSGPYPPQTVARYKVARYSFSESVL